MIYKGKKTGYFIVQSAGGACAPKLGDHVQPSPVLSLYAG